VTCLHGATVEAFGAPVDWQTSPSTPSSGEITDLVYGLSEAFSLGRALLSDGCTGDYLLFLYRYALPDDDYFAEPVPGEYPGWLVGRHFSPDPSCVSITTPCSDYWVAQVLSIEPR
jgi:hypothetical protein